jgi:hypothetical protein
MRRLGLAFIALLLLVAPGMSRAQTAADAEAVRNLVTCYPFGIDKIGRGDSDAGIALWKQCFASDYAFSVFIGYGEPTVCPGDKCPFPKEMGTVDMRAAYAKRAFDGGKFVKTSHHLTNMAVSFVDADHAVVNAYIQAWHWRADGTVIVGAGTWDVDVARQDAGWRITHEKLSIVGAGMLQPPGH